MLVTFSEDISGWSLTKAGNVKQKAKICKNLSSDLSV